jgi:predicted chitinase
VLNMSNTLLDWLPHVLREAGLKVAEEKDWLTRCRPGAFGPIKGIICHHTAGSKKGNMPSLKLVREGRSDLAGPLAQLCLGRDGTFYVVSAGRCNHAGKGSWKGITAGNTHFIGIEAENAGTKDDPWPEVQMDAYRRGVAAILKHLGLGSAMCAGHKEFAPGRKPDPRFDMEAFREAVDAIIRGEYEVPAPIPPVESADDTPDDLAPRPTLRRAAVGEPVKQLQEKLGLEPTSQQFDPKTEAAVRQLQREHGLVPDGIVGPKTWAAVDGKVGKLVASELPSLTGQELRDLWKEFECAEDKMVLIPFGPDKIRVAPPTTPAWDALATVLLHHDYSIRTDDTDSFNCRSVKGGTLRSLHAYGIALDVNWTTNPYKDHAGSRPPRFSNRDTQAGRAEEVRLGKADTDMTREMIEDVLAIKTTNGKRLFEWGGSWLTLKDAMHFQLNVGPGDLLTDDGLLTGIVSDTVAGFGKQVEEQDQEEEGDGIEPEAPEGGQGEEEKSGKQHQVTADSGLKLRKGPSTGFDAIRTVPLNAVVYVMSQSAGWAQVSLEADAVADGWMFAKHLSPVSAGSTGGAGLPRDTGDGILGQVTVAQVAKMFPANKSIRANIVKNLPFVLDGLKAFGLTDRSMVLMALATIRAETESFRPIDEGISKWNTRNRNTPFDRYENRTKDLGNRGGGDGARFKGRGYIQLTGRANYTDIGKLIRNKIHEKPDLANIGGIGKLNEPLEEQPTLANDPAVAGLILACFLWRAKTRIRSHLREGDLKAARKDVNGGSHGFDRFKSAYDIGLSVLP